MPHPPRASGEPAGSPRGDLSFVEAVAADPDLGLPRSVARALAWLTVCEPPSQTAGQLAGALGLSAGSISAAVATLTGSGLVTRHTVPGDRRTYYRIRPDAWATVLAGRLAVVSRLKRHAETAGAREVGDRLGALRDVTALWERRLAELTVPARPVRGRKNRKAGR
jgi:DNA-binding transcriptional ArsR family regulator